MVEFNKINSYKGHTLNLLILPLPCLYLAFTLPLPTLYLQKQKVLSKKYKHFILYYAF